ncbi:thermonuclease family protein [Melaminivora sp.]|uniref:thermonuclease family protein n=1 Tax=Melaminivora sp. TaxID=1933032 RepID=UPI0028B14082|nr:thermonuclease family protein [Melaminivora sp.]
MSLVTAAVLACLVTAVSDGDTLSVRCGAHRPERVRIVAIDAPEIRQAFGRQSREHLRRLCFRQRAELYRLGRDVYGRTLAHVRCSGQDVAAAQVAAGLAWVSTRDSRLERQLGALQRQAQASRSGLWSQKRPQAPWDYRKRQQRRKTAQEAR